MTFCLTSPLTLASPPTSPPPQSPSPPHSLSISLWQELNPIDPDAICAVLRFTRAALATALRPELQSVYESLKNDEPYAVTGEQVC